MSILQEIIAKNRPALNEQKRLMPLAELEALAKSAPARPGFAAAFRTSGRHVIAELKNASPSKGMIRENLEVRECAAELEKAGATALSVLTEPFYFKGSLQYLKTVSETVNLPLLRKDFIFDSYQIAQAKLNGASAILLIAAMLSASEFADLLAYAHSLGLDVLGEAHTEEELEAVRNADLVGVNARNLHDFSTSLERSAELIRLASYGKPVIAESAIRNPEDMRILEAVGASGFLIGETLMRAEKPGSKLRELLECC